MKIFTFLLLCSIIIFINAQYSNNTYCKLMVSASSAKDCKDLKVSGSGNHCCYYKLKGEGFGITLDKKFVLKYQKKNMII